jgi:hypothetical protein
MSVLTNMIKELRERKLWPIAIGLIVALVAVPVLLSKNAPTNLVTPQPTGRLPYSTGTALPAISVQTTPGAAKLAGRGRDPFTPQHAATTATTTAAVVRTASSAAAGTTAGGAATATSGSGSTTASGGSGSAPSTASAPASGPSTSAPSTSAPSTSAPSTSAPSAAPAPKPAPTGLTATQSYQVSLAITNANGGLDTIDPLKRLSVLPSPQQPLLVELGVLQGAHHVLFAVEPGAAVSGPGTCTPGPIDCEILSLAPGQTEGVSKQTATGSTPVALFSVNSITAAQHPSAAAADKARRTASEAGRKLLAASPLNATSLFQYDPSVGAVVDLRNLTVGGS